MWSIIILTFFMIETWKLKFQYLGCVLAVAVLMSLFWSIRRVVRRRMWKESVRREMLKARERERAKQDTTDQ